MRPDTGDPLVDGGASEERALCAEADKAGLKAWFDALAARGVDRR